MRDLYINTGLPRRVSSFSAHLETIWPFQNPSKMFCFSRNPRFSEYLDRSAFYAQVSFMDFFEDDENNLPPLINSGRILAMPSECTTNPLQRALADSIIRMVSLDELRILFACGAKVSSNTSI